MKEMILEIASFRDGLRNLMNASYSVKDALTAFGRIDWADDETAEQSAVRNLAMNAITHRLTANGVGWNDVQLHVTGYGVRYCTSGGLIFGWYAYMGASQLDTFRHWVFFVEHPRGWHENSTLRQSLEAAGWRKSGTPLDFGILK